MIEATKDIFLFEKEYAYKNGCKKIFNQCQNVTIKRIGLPFLLELKNKYFPGKKTTTLKVLGIKVFENLKIQYLLIFFPFFIIPPRLNLLPFSFSSNPINLYT